MNQKRFEALRAMGCIIDRLYGCPDCGPVEIHHLNLAGHAGQKRLGDDYTIPLGLWHHRGISYWLLSPKEMERIYGPSLAKQSKAFRARYGSDMELLAEVNRRISQ